MTRIEWRPKILTVLAAIYFLFTFGLQMGVAEKKGDAKVTAPEGNANAPQTAANPIVAEDYRVGAGDVIEVSVWKEPENSGIVVIRPDGKISLPLLNDLVVVGKTPMEIQQIVEEKLTPFINAPNVTVIVRDIRSKKVYIIGEVNHAGSFQITQPTTVLQMLTEAGGLRPFAKSKSIYVLRNQDGKEKRFSFNYQDALKGKNIEQNILLQPGDTVVVP